jgi:hypothetical protein
MRAKRLECGALTPLLDRTVHLPNNLLFPFRTTMFSAASKGGFIQANFIQIASRSAGRYEIATVSEGLAACTIASSG